MKQFTPKEMIIESETALASIRQQQKQMMALPSGLYIGLDVHKDTIAVSIASAHGDKPRYYAEIANTSKAVEKRVKKLSPDGEVLALCYEAGPCGYGLYRQLTGPGHSCIVVAPSLILRKPGDRVKTDRCDSESLARLHRANEKLTAVWVPESEQEAIRDLTRAREDMRSTWKGKVASGSACFYCVMVSTMIQVKANGHKHTFAG